MNHGSLFSGIGGFDLAAEWMGWENVFHCEWDDFGQKILKYYWPNATSYTDITKTDFSIHRGEVDIITGGFPCQPFSEAGKRRGKEDERYLWPEMLRAIREVQPRWIVGENVSGIINWSRGMVVNEIKTNLADEGFTLLSPVIIPACAKGAPHTRERVWFIAYCNKNQYFIKEKVRQWPASQQSNRNIIPAFWNREFITRSCFADDGLSDRLDIETIRADEWEEKSVKAAGNAIVPQVAYEIFKAIEQTELNFFASTSTNSHEKNK